MFLMQGLTTKLPLAGVITNSVGVLLWSRSTDPTFYLKQTQSPGIVRGVFFRGRVSDVCSGCAP